MSKKIIAVYTYMLDTHTWMKGKKVAKYIAFGEDCQNEGLGD